MRVALSRIIVKKENREDILAGGAWKPRESFVFLYFPYVTKGNRANLKVIGNDTIDGQNFMTQEKES